MSKINPIVSESDQTCPVCHADWRGKKIQEKHREYYGNHTHFSRLLAHEISDVYDGVLYWQCPDCKNNFPRFKRSVSEIKKLDDGIGISFEQIPVPSSVIGTKEIDGEIWVSVCSYCKDQKEGTAWGQKIGHVSHSVCPTCSKREIEKYKKRILARIEKVQKSLDVSKNNGKVITS